MKVLNFLNPQKWIGQIAVLVCFFLLGVSITLWKYECPPTTQINQNIKNKSKKGGVIDSEVNVKTQTCDEWLKSLSAKEVRQIRKN